MNPDEPYVDELDVSDIGVDSIFEAAGLGTPLPPAAEADPGRDAVAAAVRDRDELSDLGLDAPEFEMGIGDSAFGVGADDEDAADTDPAGLTGVDSAFFASSEGQTLGSGTDDDWAHRPSFGERTGLGSGSALEHGERRADALGVAAGSRTRLAAHVRRELTGQVAATSGVAPPRTGPGFVAEWLSASGSSSVVEAGAVGDFADQRLTPQPDRGEVPDDFARVALSDELLAAPDAAELATAQGAGSEARVEFDLELPDDGVVSDLEPLGVGASGIVRRRGTATGADQTTPLARRTPSALGLMPSSQRNAPDGGIAEGLLAAPTVQSNVSTQRPVEIRGQIGSGGALPDSTDAGQVIARTRVKQRMVRRSDAISSDATDGAPAEPEASDEPVD